MSDNLEEIKRDVSSVLNFLEVKLEVWYIDRHLTFKPPHFVMAATPITKESAIWIIHNLAGRFTIIEAENPKDPYVYNMVPAFEDPVEATLYELTWS